MFDVGVSLEPERAELIEQMRNAPPQRWTREQVGRIKEGMGAGVKGIPLKLVYGSDFPYRGAEEHAPADFEGVGVRGSFAKGGLSNVWGAAMMPCRSEDVTDWPVPLSQLAPHYASVLKLTGLSAKADGLANLFPLYAERTPALELSRQSKTLLRRLERNQAQLEKSGIHFGQARVAVRVAEGQSPGCAYCGLCMYGCPYGFIYNSETTLEALRRDPNFTYQPGVTIRRFEENAKGITAVGNRTNGEVVRFEAERAFLAAGVIPSTQILMRSVGALDETVWMRDSQYFLLPLALVKGARDVRREELYTLSQIFMEILDHKISPHTVHLQVYSYNDLVGQAVRKAMGALARPLELMARALEGRLLVVQGYLHSTHSSRIAVALRKGASGRERLQLRAEINPATKPMIGKVISKLSRHARHLGGIPLAPMLQIAEPGRGFHSGGTFPMNAKPGRFETDVLGRPQNWSRLHVVDATVLPTIPATTITFTVMANAHRIGWEAGT